MSKNSPWIQDLIGKTITGVRCEEDNPVIRVFVEGGLVLVVREARQDGDLLVWVEVLSGQE